MIRIKLYNKHSLLRLFFLLFTILAYSQNNNTLNIVNSSSLYSNNIEYNTGEIFVVYNFDSNEVTSKSSETKKNIVSEFLPKITIYPNPTKEIVYYNLPNNIVFESVEVYDINQKSVYYSSYNNEQVSFQNLPNGTYFIVFNKNSSYNFKIIKQ